LTSREREVVAELAKDGPSNKDIAKRLYISEQTVKWHLMSAMFIAEVNNRVALVLWWIRTGQYQPTAEEEADARD